MNTLKLNDKKDIEYSSFLLHKNGLSPIGTPTYKQWQEAGEFIRKAEGSVHFWIGDWLNYGEKMYGETYSQAIDGTGYGIQTLMDDKWVASRIEISRRRENLPFRMHKDVANLDSGDQEKLLRKAETEHIKSNEFRKVVRDFKHAQLPESIIPKGEFNVIYADPPWKYEFSETKSREIENQYPTMEIEEICNIKVPTAKNTVLLLWTTAPKLEEALMVLNSWGFTYKTNLVWDKELIGMGYWFRGQHEILMVGTIGNPPVPNAEERISSVYREQRTEHSKKPLYFYELIEKYFPNGKYLELFARKKFNEKWTVFGNQL